MERQHVFLDISIDNIKSGRICIELFNDIAPKTCSNFYHLCIGDKGNGKETEKPLFYKDCIFHRVTKGFVLQSGDFSKFSGKGGESIYGGVFEDENFLKNHSKAGLLSMANSGKNSNGSQFFITLDRLTRLDNKHVVFGRVIKGMDIVRKMENVPVDEHDKPIGEVKIFRCGDLKALQKIESEVFEAEQNEQKKQIEENAKEQSLILKQNGQNFDKKNFENYKSGKNGQNSLKEISTAGPDLSKMTEKEKMFYELQLEFRSSARDTKREVMRELRRNNSKKDQNSSFVEKTHPKKRSKKSNLTANAANLLYEKQRNKNKQSEDRSFDFYLRKIDAIDNSGKKIKDENDLVNENDFDAVKNTSEDQMAINRLSEEIKENQAKRRKYSRRRTYRADRDVSFINRRNEAFNAKVGRAFDKFTADIRNNLERGTAI